MSYENQQIYLNIARGCLRNDEIFVGTREEQALIETLKLDPDEVIEIRETMAWELVHHRREHLIIALKFLMKSGVPVEVWHRSLPCETTATVKEILTTTEGVKVSNTIHLRVEIPKCQMAEEPYEIKIELPYTAQFSFDGADLK